MNMGLGVIAILLSSHHQLWWAAACISVALVCDALDGHFARALGVASDFGVQMDSLADMTSFVTAGSILSFYWLEGQGPAWLLGAVSVLYVVMGGLRLARFNTGAKASDEFQGMPTTAMGALLCASYFNEPHMGSIGIFFVALGSLLMMSQFPYPKFNKVLRLPSWVYPLIAFSAKISTYYTVWACVIAYLLSGPIILSRRQSEPSEASEEWKKVDP